MNFYKPTIEDKTYLAKYYENVPYMNCELDFANFFLWSEHYGTKYAVVDDMLVLVSVFDNKRYVAMPIGPGDRKRAIEDVARDFKAEGYDLYLNCITESMFAEIDEMFPGCFKIEYNRDMADYIYTVEKLAYLKGKKLHGKRNHIAKFIENNDWQYEDITDENTPECIEMARQWRVMNGCDINPEKSYELCVTMRALAFRKELGLTGGLIRANGRVVAFTLGSPAGGDTFDIHIEKAFADVQGAYPMINRQFVLNNLLNYKYVNREEDTGAEGLRKAKLSYYPDILLEKGVASLTEKGRQYFYGE